MKRRQSGLFKIVRKMLNTLLVSDGWIFVGCTRIWFRWIFATIPVHLVEMLCFCVVGFELVIFDRPGGRGSSVVTNLAKVFLPQTEKRGSIEFSIAANEIVCVWM